MRALLMALSTLTALPAWCGEDILAVLQRSQQMQLDALTRTQVERDSADAQILQGSFDKVMTTLNVAPGDVQLIVVRSPLLAVCLMGKVIAVNAAVAQMPEGERLFILAHEIGHTVRGHWAQFGALYKQHIPGDVLPTTTDPVARLLGAQASELSHRQEFEADAFALRVLQRLGERADTPIVMFQQHLPPVKTTATHPGTHQRIAHLQQLGN